MQFKQALLSLAAITLAVLVGLVLWIDRAPAERSAAPAPARGSAPAADMHESAATLRRPSAPERIALDDLELAQADWVEGTLVLPDDLPTDEQLQLFAASARGTGEWVETRCEVSSDGRFRAPFLASAHSRELRITARYLYLAAPVPVSDTSETPRVEPALGAWLKGRFVAPAGAQLPEFQARLRMQGGAQDELAADVDPDTGAVEFRGLPAGRDWRLTADPGGFASVYASQLHSMRGERIERTWSLARGVYLAGRVVDEQGRPLAGVRVEAQTWGRPTGLGLERSVETDTDGTFVLGAVAPGKVTLAARGPGYAPRRFEPQEFVDGARATNLELVLDRGNALAGRVVWPDGRAAHDAGVSVHETTRAGTHSGWRDHLDHDARCGADGAFEVTGLGAGPFAVRALAIDADGTTWRAASEPVELGDQVELVLAASPALAGRVQDDRGRPVEAYTLRLAEQRTGAAGSGEWPEREVAIDSADGAFLIDDVGPGRWTLEANAPGHAVTRVELVLPRDDARELVLELARAASAEGLVVDPSGAPVAGAAVEVLGPYQRRVWSIAPAVSGADGTFEFEELPPTSSILVATHPGWAPSAGVPIELQPGTAVEAVRLELVPGGQLTGEIYEDSGAADGGRQIAVRDLGANRTRSTFADGDGRFEMSGLSPGPHQVMAFPSGDETDLLAELRVATVTIEVEAPAHVVLGTPKGAAVELRGRVLDGDTGVPGVSLTALIEGGRVIGGVERARTDPTGHFAMTLSGAGDYLFLVNAIEYAVRVPDVAVHELELRLPTGRIEGRVVGSEGQPVANLAVSFETLGPHTEVGPGPAAVRTDDAGQFEITGLRAGAYVLRAASRRSTDGSGHHAVAIADEVVVSEGAATAVELIVEPAGRLFGSVWNELGEPVARASIFVRAESGRLLEPFSSTTTNAEGQFEFHGCPPGRFTVVARRGSSAATESEPVLVSAGGDTPVELVLAPGAELVVVAEDASGEPLRAAVQVLDERGRDQAQGRDAEGVERLLGQGISALEKRVGPLPPGRYSVRVTAADGRAGSRTIHLRAGSSRTVRVRVE